MENEFRKKNILIIVPSIRIDGGAEKVATFLANKLVRNNHVKLLTFYNKNNELALDVEQLTFSENPNAPKLLKLFSRALKISNLCKKHKINTVISHMEESNFSAILSKFFGNKSKIIITSHNNPMRYGLLYRTAIKKLYPNADLLVTVSIGTRNIFFKHFKIKNCTTIYNPLEIENSIKKSKEPIDSKTEQIFKNSFIFLSIGRLEIYKGHQYLINAFKGVNKQYPNSKLIIIGNGSQKKNLELLIKKHALNDNVFLLGNKKNVFPFISKCDCFVFPSEHEGFGLVLLETLLFNKPVISTDCNFGPREILAPEISLDKSIPYPYFGKYGILIENFSKGNGHVNERENTLMDLMIYSIENQSKNKYNNGLERVKNFNTNKIINLWENLIN